MARERKKVGEFYNLYLGLILVLGDKSGCLLSVEGNLHFFGFASLLRDRLKKFTPLFPRWSSATCTPIHCEF